MKIEEIRELAQIMKENGLGMLELQEDGTNLRMEAASAAAPAAPAVVPVVQAVPAAAPVQAAPAAPASAASAAPVATQDGTPVDFYNLKEVKSPMVGVFYQAPSPEADPYVRVGSKVKKGDVLCVIEAMKLLNEITADTDGEIVDVCVENGQLVEYGQVLFKIF